MRSSKFEIQSWNLDLSLSLWNLDTLQTSIWNPKPPTLNFTLELRANFGYHKLGPNRQKKIAKGPLCKAFFCEGQAALSLEAFSRLWEAWGGHWEVGRCFRRLWGGFGKPYHRKTRKNWKCASPQTTLAKHKRFAIVLFWLFFFVGLRTLVR